MSNESTATNVLLAVDFNINGFPITGAYDVKSGSLIAHIKEIPLKQLLPKNIQSFVPELSVKDITALYRKDEEGKKIYRISAGLGSEINMSKLPLVGKVFASGNTFKIDKFQVTAGNTDPKLGISADIYLGDKKLPLDLPLLKSRPKSNLKDKDNTKVKDDKNAAKTPAPTSKVVADEDDAEELEKRDGSAFWIKLNRDFGPVSLKRIGIKFENNVLTLIIDGKLSLGPLQVSMHGLSVSNPLDKFSPSFNLDGLGLNFRKGSLSIAGAFLKDPTEKDSYAGTVTIALPSFGISALGAYQEIDGQPSLFIFGVLTMANGIGPTFLQIKGIAAGFGYNRELKIPSIGKIKEFPLVSAMLSTNPKNDQDPLETLTNIKKYIPASTGNMFFALGVTFTSYKCIDGIALLTLSLGKRNRLDLIGLATYATPPPSTNLPPVVQVELALLASYDFDEGVLKIEAALTDASFLFSSQCRLRGGFAFYSWFKGPHAGDFVLTLGGYHPRYKCPAHFPKVNRLGFHWQISSNMTVKGEMYFALTANALMLGGLLEAHFSTSSGSKSVSASFIFYCNFLIQWQPFYYDAEIGLSISVNVSFSFWGIRKNLNLGFSAQLWVRGPEFSGIAKVSLSILSFEIKFGAEPKKPDPLTWSEFEKAFLPDRSKISNLIVAAGLLRELDMGGGQKQQVINPATLDISISSEIPLQIIKIPEEVSKSGEKSLLIKNREIRIPSMGDRVVEQSSLTLKITNAADTGNNKTDLTHRFDIELVDKPMATAQWKTNETTSEQRMEKMLTGCRIKPKPMQLPDKTEKKPVSAFAYDRMCRDKAFGWTKPLKFEKSGDASALNKINNVQTSTTREKLLKSMGIGTESICLNRMKECPEEAFLRSPKFVSN